MKIVSLLFTIVLIGSPAPASAARPTACGLISAIDMSAVLGSEVTALADDRGGQTKCTYEVSGADIGGVYAEVEVNWGDGIAGMKGVGAMEPHIGAAMSQLAGLGDQATAVGQMIMIRRGDDLITLVISGVPDSAAAAKRIYDLLDQRLSKLPTP